MMHNQNFFLVAKFVYAAIMRDEWLSGINSFRQVTEVKLSRVRSDSGLVTSGAGPHNSPRRPSEGTLNYGSHA